MAADLHGLLTQLGRARDVRIVGHDIGSMVAYSYAAAYPTEGTKLEWFRAMPQDVRNDALYQKTPITMPVLAIGASNSLGTAVGDQAKKYARHVTTVVVPDSGHWIYEEHPARTTARLLTFLGGKS
jgi:pimeloyl-ACP methyl ester carboxylesterase